MVPKFNIGDLDLPPSRETVSYEPRTIAAIKAKYDAIRDELSPLIFDQLRKLPLQERFKAISQMQYLSSFHNRWMVSTGKRDEDQGKLTEDRKWGTFIEKSLEWVSIPVRVQHFTTRWTYANGQVLKQKPETWEPWVVTRMPEGRFFWNQDLKKVRDRLEDIRDRNVYVFSPTDDIPDLKTLRQYIDLKFELLSDLPEPSAKTRVKNAPLVYDVNHNVVEELPDGAVWIGRDDLHPYPTPKLFRLGKMAQKYHLNDTHRSYDQWRAEMIETLKNDPRAQEFIAARKSNAPYYWIDFLQKNPRIFPEATAEIHRREVEYEHAEYLSLVPELEDTPALTFPTLEKTIAENPRLDAYLRGCAGCAKPQDHKLFI